MIGHHRAARVGRARAETLPHEDRTAHTRLAALASIVAMASALALLSSMAAEARVTAGPVPAPASLINF